MFWLLINEDIVAFGAIGYSYFTEITLSKIDLFEFVQLLKDFIVGHLLFIRTQVWTCFSMHDGSPAWSLEILKTDFRVSGKFINFLVVDWWEFIVKEKSFLFYHYYLI